MAEGRCCPGASRVLVTRHTRRTPHPVPTLHAVSDDTLRGRDGKTISADHAPSKHYLRLCAALLMRTSRAAVASQFSRNRVPSIFANRGQRNIDHSAIFSVTRGAR